MAIYEGATPLTIITRVLGTAMFFFVMWYIWRYISQKSDKDFKGGHKSQTANVFMWLIGLFTIIFGLFGIFLSLLLLIPGEGTYSVLRFLAGLLVFAIAGVVIYGGYVLIRMAEGTLKRPSKKQLFDSMQRTYPKMNIEDIEKIKKKNAYLWCGFFIGLAFIEYLIIIPIVTFVCKPSQIGNPTTYSQLIRSCGFPIVLSSILIIGAIFFFILAQFIRKYRAVGFLGALHPLSEQKARVWQIAYIVMGVIEIIIALSLLLYLL